MGFIRIAGNTINSGVKKVGNFIANHGGRSIWNKTSPILQGTGKLIGEDIKDVYNAAKWVGGKAWGATKAVGRGALNVANATNEFDDKYLGGAGKQALATGARNLAYAAVKKFNPDLGDNTIKGYVDPGFNQVSKFISDKVKRKGYSDKIYDLSKGNGNNGLGVSFQNAYRNPYSNAAHSGVSHW